MGDGEEISRGGVVVERGDAVAGLKFGVEDRDEKAHFMVGDVKGMRWERRAREVREEGKGVVTNA